MRMIRSLPSLSFNCISKLHLILRSLVQANVCKSLRSAGGREERYAVGNDQRGVPRLATVLGQLGFGP